MDKTLQDLAWSVLPKEFKEEVKKEWKLTDNIERLLHDAFLRGECQMMRDLFGRHNLTSDAEEEEMLTVSHKKVQEFYAKCKEVTKNPYSYPDYSQESALSRMALLDILFGSKCLPDEEVDDDFKVPEPNCKHFKDGKCAHPAVSHLENGKLVKGADCDVSSCEDVEYEPKFKVGDTVRFKYCCTPHRINGLFKMSNSEMLYLVGEVWAKESELEPYTEPEEKSCTDTCTDDCSSQCKSQDFGTIVKDSFRNERRLNIAAQIVASMVGSDDWTTWRGGSNKEIWHNMAKSSLEIADALLAEVEKKGDEE